MKISKNLLFLFLASVYFYIYNIYPGNIINEFFVLYQNAALHTASAYFHSILIFFFISSSVSVFYGLVRRVLLRVFTRTETKFDDILLQMFDSFIIPIKYAVALCFIAIFVSLPQNIAEFIYNGTNIIFLILLLFFITKLINIVFTEELIEKSKLKAISRSLLPFINKVLVVVVWVIGIITILSNLGYDVTALIAGAGIGGIALALAAQKSIANIFGAITILMNRPFKIGDYVVVNGITGTVKDIGLSYLTLISREGHQVMIPNETIISTSIENQTVRKYRRADFSIGLIYDTSLLKMQKGVEIIENILEGYVEERKLQSYRVNFEAFGDFSLNINVAYFSGTKDYTDFVKEKEAINLEIKKQFTKAKLEMAFPTTEMIIKNGDIK